jgi:hypothetical protein
MGASIATIGRNTAAALGIAFGYLAIVENAIRGLRPSWMPWLLGDNSVVVITNQPQSFPLLGRSNPGGGDAGCLLHPGPAGRGPAQLPSTRHHLTGQRPRTPRVARRDARPGSRPFADHLNRIQHRVRPTPTPRQVLGAPRRGVLIACS